MSRFISWLALGVAAAFLVVASVAFSLATVAALAFAISIGTLVVAAGIAYSERASTAAVATAALMAAISAWTIAASVIFSQPTVQHLALGAALAMSGLAIIGLTTHEVSLEHAAGSASDTSTEREGRLAAAA